MRANKWAAERKLRAGPSTAISGPIPPGPPQQPPPTYPRRISPCCSGRAEASFRSLTYSNLAGGTDGAHSEVRWGREIRVGGLRQPDQGVSHHRMVQQRRLSEGSRRFHPQIVENGTQAAGGSVWSKLRAGSGWRECKYAYVGCFGKLRYHSGGAPSPCMGPCFNQPLHKWRTKAAASYWLGTPYAVLHAEARA